MFGRTDESSQIAAAIRRSDIVSVVLSGGAGVGKSRLLASSTDHAAEQGFAVVRLFGSHATSELPLCSFNSFLGSVADEEQTEQHTEHFVAVRKALIEHGQGRPLFIAVDDAHLLDDASAALVGQLAREFVAFVACTVRTGEPAPQSISSLWTQGIATHIRIEPLNRDASEQVVADLLGGRVSPGLANDLWKRTSGNPLYLRELVLGSTANGSIAERDGWWTRVGTLAPSEVLSDLVRQRVGALSEAQHHALTVVALSEPASAGLIEAVADLDSLVALDDAGLVVVTEDRRRLSVRLAHPVYGDVVRAATSVLRARSIRRSLAEATKRFGARRHDDALRMATWRLGAGEVDAELFAVAAFDAMRRHDLELAESLASAAHAADPNELSARALGMTLHLIGRHDEASATLGAMLEQLPAGSADWARVGLVAGLVRARGMGDFPAACAVLEDVVAADGTPRVLRRAGAMLAMIDLLQSLPDRCLARLQPLIDAGATEAEAITGLVGALTASGRPGEALHTADQYVAQHGDPDERSLFPDFLCFAKVEAGQLDGLFRDLTDGWEHAIEVDARHRQGRLAMLLGHVALERGQLATARTWFDRSITLSIANGERFCERWSLAGSILAAAQMGDTTAADDLAAALEAVPSHPAQLFESFALRGEAWRAAGGGDRERAFAELSAFADRLIADGTLAHAVRVLVDIARLGAPDMAVVRAEAISGTLDGPLLPALVGFVRAMASGDPDELGHVAEALAAVGNAAIAADAAHAAGAAWTERGDTRAANAWSLRAHELLASTEGVAAPWLATVERVVPLTRREREIAGLVAAGRASREVADACFLSVRTVESHLARIYDKLGVRSRSELSEVMSRLTLAEAGT